MDSREKTKAKVTKIAGQGSLRLLAMCEKTFLTANNIVSELHADWYVCVSRQVSQPAIVLGLLTFVVD